MKEKQREVDIVMEQLVAGQEAGPQRKVYKTVTKNLERCVERYPQTEILEFLRGVAHNLGY